MNERFYSKQTTSEQLDDFYKDQDPLKVSHALGLRTISTIALMEKIDTTLEENSIVIAASSESPQKPEERTALEKLRIAQGRKPGDSVSVPVPEPGSRVRAVRKPVKITPRTPKKNR